MRNRINNIDNVCVVFLSYIKKRGKKRKRSMTKKNVTDENVMRNLLVIEHV
jgi:hypothetical protein